MLLFVLRFSPEFAPIDYLFYQSRELPGPKRLCHFSSVPILLPIWKVLHGCPWGNQLQREEVTPGTYPRGKPQSPSKVDLS